MKVRVVKRRNGLLSRLRVCKHVRASQKAGGQTDCIRVSDVISSLSSSSSYQSIISSHSPQQSILLSPEGYRKLPVRPLNCLRLLTPRAVVPAVSTAHDDGDENDMVRLRVEEQGKRQES